VRSRPHRLERLPQQYFTALLARVAERLLTEHRLAVAPGEGFGSRGAGRARLSLAVSDETLELGLERLQAALDGLQ